jgi:hypothetical protein
VKEDGGPHGDITPVGQPSRLISDGEVETVNDSTGFELFECELDWTYTIHVETGSVEVQLQKHVTATDAPDIDYLADAPRFDGDIPDSRAAWHHNYTPIDCWFRAHIFRGARGFSIQEAAEYLQEAPSTALWMGFFGETVSNNPERVDPPGYTQLRDMWEEEFSARMRGAVQVIGQRLVEFARDRGFPAPNKVFLPEDDVDPDKIEEDDPTIRELTTGKTADIWEHARPMVIDH